MKILLLYRGAERVRSRKVVEGEWLRVGRNASCEIHLPDPRIALERGLIVNRDGLVFLEGEAGSQDITRSTVQSTRLSPGTALDLGPYRLESMDPPEGFDGAITIDAARPLKVPDDLADRMSRRTLESVGFSKRGVAWGFLALVAIVFLAFPAGRVLDLPWRDASATMAIGDRFWNPGPVMLAHQPIEQRCDACHQVAFQHVPAGACLECHSGIGRHGAPDLAPAALFQDTRCTSCHREHKGAKTTHRDDDRFCVDCHRDIKPLSAEAASMNVADFARDHPAFRLTVGDRRERQGGAPIREQAGLAFDHAKHLDPAGVKSPEKGRVRLECGACHRPDASRRSFVPIVMERDCRDCHRLQFEPAVTTREVPHGNAAEAATVIEEFYANLALKGVRDSFHKAFGIEGEGLLRRVGEPSAAERQNALALAGRKAKLVAHDLFEVRVCKTCHEVANDGKAWSVKEVKASHGWMPQARFDHKSHAQTPCLECHDVRRSKKSSDVAMPTIQTCRRCHGGSRPASGKVTSNCLLCHGFHDAKHNWDPQFKPRKPPARVAQGTSDAR